MLPHTDWLEEVARLLDAAAAGGGRDACLAALRQRTRGELLAASREVGLKRVSKLPKELLARRVLDALVERQPEPSGGRPPPEAGKPAPRRGKPAKARAASAASPAPPERPGVPRPGEAAAAPPGGEAERDPTPLAKLDLGPGAPAEPPVEHIPWGYGQDRVTAAAVDPEQLYAWWEVTDPSIERARKALGPGGAGAWLNLRVYDTSGIIFDGTNAHGYFDHAVDRSTRQWFFAIGKPTSTAYVEVGMKSSEGYFAKIARSGRVDFPRREPAPWSEPEWMTVVAATGEAVSAGRGAPARPPAPTAPGPGGPAAPFAPIPLWVMRETGEAHELHVRELRDGYWEQVEWSEVRGEGWYEIEGRIEWQGPAVLTTWEAGPFAHPVQIEPPRREEWQGKSYAYRVGEVTHVVYGPWRVVIHDMGARSGHAVVSRWEVYRSWVTSAGREVRLAGVRPPAPPGASEALAPGASERAWAAGSELRLGGASERWRLGASEVRLAGASERMFRGASERRLAGASEQRAGGASEWRLGGASERSQQGASERMFQGASELAGASERRLGGAGEADPGQARPRSGSEPMPYPSLEGEPAGPGE